MKNTDNKYYVKHKRQSLSDFKKIYTDFLFGTIQRKWRLDVLEQYQYSLKMKTFLKKLRRKL